MYVQTSTTQHEHAKQKQHAWKGMEQPWKLGNRLKMEELLVIRGRIFQLKGAMPSSAQLQFRMGEMHRNDTYSGPKKG